LPIHAQGCQIDIVADRVASALRTPDRVSHQTLTLFVFSPASFLGGIGQLERRIPGAFTPENNALEDYH
jgi:hypothetical protein